MRYARTLLALCASALCAPPSLASETTAYAYDARGRLVQVVHSGTVNNGVGSSYCYDKADNRTNVTVATSGDGATPTFGISGGLATEGSAVVFTVTKCPTASGTLTVSFATSGGTATSGTDFTATSGTLSFLAGETAKTISVPTIDDASIESAENFTVILSSASVGSTIGTATGTGTINDNDSTPTCSGVSFTIASNAAVTEGASSGFTITKTGAASNSCSINYATSDGTAVAPGDYTAASGTLVFTSAQTAQTVGVTTIDDASVESAETFTMSLSSPTGGSTVGAPSSAPATVNDNDGNHPPTTVADGAGATVCQTVTINVTANDSDIDGDLPLTVISVTDPFYLVSSTSVGFDAPNRAGSYTGTYVVQDSRGAQASGAVNVGVSSGTCNIGNIVAPPPDTSATDTQPTDTTTDPAPTVPQGSSK